MKVSLLVIREDLGYENKSELMIQKTYIVFKMVELATRVKEYFDKVTEVINGLDTNLIEKFAELLLQTYEQGGVVYVFGNGGSGATASHFCSRNFLIAQQRYHHKIYHLI